MKALRLACGALVAVCLCFSSFTKVHAQLTTRGAASNPYPVVTGKAYKFEKIFDGVYYATSTGAMVTGSNNVVIVGDRNVMVVDTGTTPAAARAMLEDLKLITDRPVRYVV